MNKPTNLFFAIAALVTSNVYSAGYTELRSESNFSTDEKIVIEHSHGTRSPSDWVGIYRAGTLNQSCYNNGQLLRYAFTGGVLGSVSFSELPEGEYVAQLFANKSFCHAGNYIHFSVEEDKEEDDTGEEDSGDDGTGEDGSGDDDSGEDGSGDDNSGEDGSGDDDSGEDGSGDDDSGEEDSANVGPTLSFANVFAKDNNNVGVVIDASSKKGKITKIELYIDGSFVRTEKVTPFEWGQANKGQTDSAIQNLAPGSYKLLAVATDNNGETAEIEQILVIEDTQETEKVSAEEDSKDGDVCFYTSANYTGSVHCFNSGVRITDLTPMGLANDFSSIKVKSGFGAVVCDHRGFVACALVQNDIKNLSNIYFSNSEKARNDITSFRIFSK